MGQYYKFVNRTRQEVSEIALPFNFGLPYAKSLENYEDKEVEAMFRFVTKHNAEWQEEDELVAEGDYGAAIWFDHVKQKSGYPWESYTPKSVSPSPWTPDEENA